MQRLNSPVSSRVASRRARMVIRRKAVEVTVLAVHSPCTWVLGRDPCYGHRKCGASHTSCRNSGVRCCNTLAITYLPCDASRWAAKSSAQYHYDCPKRASSVLQQCCCAVRSDLSG